MKDQQKPKPAHEGQKRGCKEIAARGAGSLPGPATRQLYSANKCYAPRSALDNLQPI